MSTWTRALPSVVLFWSCSVCHTGHEEVNFHPFHFRPEYNALTRTTELHAIPAACSLDWVCDVRCEDLDKGRSEAHPTHPTIKNPTLFKQDQRCKLEDGNWRPR